MMFCMDTTRLAEIARDVYDTKDEGMIAGMEKAYRAMGFDVYEDGEGFVTVQPEPAGVRSLHEMWR